MQNSTNGTHSGATVAIGSSQILTVEEVASILHLKPNVKGEWCGSNPNGEGATNDGFILYADGNAFDRKLNRPYSSPDVAKMAGIKPEQYERCAAYFAQNGDSRPVFPSGHTNGHPAVLESLTAPQNIPKAKEKASKQNDSRTMEKRGIKPETLETFGFKLDSTLSQYRYPTFTTTGEPGRERWKNLKADQPKYLWKPGDARPKGEIFGLKQLLEINPYPVEVWIVGGEIDVLTCFEAGILAVATFGETQGIETLIEALETVGVEKISVALDNDEAGQTGAAKIFEIAKSRDIEPTLYVLGGKDGRDINDVWNDSKCDAETFKQALLLARVETSTETPTAPQTPPKFALVSLSELSKRPPREWLIQDIFHVESTALLTAKHASYKSFLALDMGLCVATGQKWHTRSVKRGPVVYIAAEGGAGLIKRVKAWLQNHSLSDGMGDFQFPADFHVIEKAVQLANAADLGEISRLLAPLKPALIVVDTQARCTIGLEENSTRDMSRFYDAVELLARESGACVLCVHHNNKSGEYRGASSIPAAIDFHLSLTRTDDKERATLTFEKTKDGQEPDPMVFSRQIVSIEGGGGLEHSIILNFESDAPTGQFSFSEIDERVFQELIEAFGETGATTSQWQKVCVEAGVNERIFHRSKKKLLNLGRIICDGEPGKRGAKFCPISKEIPA